MSGLKLKKVGKKVIFDIHENIALQILSKEYIPKILRKIISKIYRLYEIKKLKKFDALIIAEHSYKKYYSSLNKNLVTVLNMPKIEHLKKFYSEYNFKNDDILEHSNILMNFLEDLNFILKNNFFFTATDYGYQKLPKESTLRLISNHQPIKLFDKFENVDYSFGVNFELIKKVFKKFNPKFISQKDLIENFLPKEFKNTTEESILKAKKILNSEIFFNMGSSFSNISFFSK